MARAHVLLAASLGCCLYAYVAYPAILKLLGLLRRPYRRPDPPASWPQISVTIPVHNEAGVIAETLERILELDYPAGRRQVLVVSDASTDGTDEIVARFAARGVELVRLARRAGKTAAENAARNRLRGAIIVNTDAAVRIHPLALKRLVTALADTTVGVASGRDVSVARLDAQAKLGESAYVDYEMWVRDLETRLGGIVGASGCLYAIRAELHRELIPENLSRDFAAALIARRHGLRAVSVPDAICFVPAGKSLRQEYRRKVRTMARGLRTLWEMRALLSPRRYGLFAWMLFSHKLCRWLVPWALVGVVGAVASLAGGRPWLLAGLAAGVALAGLGWLWPEGRPMPRLLALPAYLVAGSAAGLHAWLRALRGGGTAVWEPTRRGRAGASGGRAAIDPAAERDVRVSAHRLRRLFAVPEAPLPEPGEGPAGRERPGRAGRGRAPQRVATDHEAALNGAASGDRLGGEQGRDTGGGGGRRDPA
jgi:glycosyltransferase involved in cell wall biosynthesis